MIKEYLTPSIYHKKGANFWGFFIFLFVGPKCYCSYLLGVPKLHYKEESRETPVVDNLPSGPLVAKPLEDSIAPI